MQETQDWSQASLVFLGDLSYLNYVTTGYVNPLTQSWKAKENIHH